MTTSPGSKVPTHFIIMKTQTFREGVPSRKTDDGAKSKERKNHSDSVAVRLKVEFLIFIKNDGNGLTPLKVESYFLRCRSLPWPKCEKCSRISALREKWGKVETGEVWKLGNFGNFAFECREVV